MSAIGLATGIRPPSPASFRLPARGSSLAGRGRHGAGRSSSRRGVTMVRKLIFSTSLRPGDVPVMNCSERPAAARGELFSTASVGRGARGAIIDGYIRDREKIAALGFPVLGRGCRPTDSLGRVSTQAVDVDIDFGGVKVSTGDL